MADEQIVSVKGLSKSYGGFRALRGVSFSAESSNITSILGPNGAGKTTLLRIITGTLTYDSGSVRVMGLEVRERGVEARSFMGIVYENPILFPELSVRENLRIAGRLHGLKGRALIERIHDVASRMGLEEHMDRKYAHLSKGLKRRADVASALLHDPPILVLDEPTSGLDILGAYALREIIREIRDEGKTIIMSTHNITEAMTVSDKIVLLDRGVVRAMGTPRSLRQLIGGVKEIIIDAGTQAEKLLPLIKQRVEARTIGGGRIIAKGRDIIDDIEWILSEAKRNDIQIRDISVRDLEWEEVVYRLLSGEKCPTECPLARSCAG